MQANGTAAAQDPPESSRTNGTASTIAVPLDRTKPSIKSPNGRQAGESNGSSDSTGDSRRPLHPREDATPASYPVPGPPGTQWDGFDRVGDGRRASEVITLDEVVIPYADDSTQSTVTARSMPSARPRDSLAHENLEPTDPTDKRKKYKPKRIGVPLPDMSPELYEDVVFGGEEAEKAFFAGNKLFSEGYYEEALDNFSRAINRDEGLAHAYLHRAITYQELGFYGAALVDARMVVELDPTIERGYITLCILLYIDHEVDTLREVVDEGLEWFPTSFYLTLMKLAINWVDCDYDRVIPRCHVILNSLSTVEFPVIFKVLAFLAKSNSAQVERWVSNIVRFSNTHPTVKKRGNTKGITRHNAGRQRSAAGTPNMSRRGLQRRASSIHENPTAQLEATRATAFHRFRKHRVIRKAGSSLQTMKTRSSGSITKDPKGSYWNEAKRDSNTNMQGDFIPRGSMSHVRKGSVLPASDQKPYSIQITDSFNRLGMADSFGHGPDRGPVGKPGNFLGIPHEADGEMMSHESISIKPYSSKGSQDLRSEIPESAAAMALKENKELERTTSSGSDATNTTSSSEHLGPYVAESVVVTVKQATELRKSDYFTRPDPYVVVATKQETWNTSTKKNVKEAFWMESHTFSLHNVETINFAVWDYDRVSRDDKIGEVEVKLAKVDFSLGAQDHHLELKGREARGVQLERYGNLIVRLAPIPDPRDVIKQKEKKRVIRSFGQEPPTEGSTTPRDGNFTPRPESSAGRSSFSEPVYVAEKINLVVQHATSLKKSDRMGKSDPYVVATFGDQKWQSTVKKGKGQNPVWEESHIFDIMGYADEDPFHISVWDKDRIGSDDLMGEITVTMGWLNLAQGPRIHVLNLVNNSSHTGQLTVKVIPHPDTLAFKDEIAKKKAEACKARARRAPSNASSHGTHSSHTSHASRASRSTASQVSYTAHMARRRSSAARRDELLQSRLKDIQGRKADESAVRERLGALMGIGLMHDASAPYGQFDPQVEKQALLELFKDHDEAAGRAPIQVDCKDVIIHHIRHLIQEGMHLIMFDQAFDRGLEALKNASVIAKMNVFTAEVARIYNHMGAGYRFQGQHEQSILHHELALEAGQGVVDLAKTYSGLGNAHFSLGNYHKALEYHLKHLESEEAAENSAGKAFACNNIACVQFVLGRFDAACFFYEEYLMACEKSNDVVGRSTALNNLAHCYIQLKEFDVAQDILAECVECHPELYQNTVAKYPASKAHRLSFLRQEAQTYRLITEVFWRLKAYPEALEWAERGKHRSVLDNLTRKINAEGQGDMNIEQLHDVATTQNMTIVMYTLLLRRRILIWVIKPNKVQVVHHYSQWPDDVPTDLKRFAFDAVAEAEMEILDTALDDDSQGTDSTGMSESTVVLCRLYDALIRPIEIHLPRDPSTHVVLIPHARLYYIPWAALQKNQYGRTFVDEHTFSLAISASHLVDTYLNARRNFPEYEARSSFVAFDSSVLNAKREAKMISSYLKCSAIDGTVASKMRLAERIPGAEVVHINAHKTTASPHHIQPKPTLKQTSDMVPVVGGANVEVHPMDLTGYIYFRTKRYDVAFGGEDQLAPSLAALHAIDRMHAFALREFHKMNLTTCRLCVLNTTGDWDEHNADNNDNMLLAREVFASGAAGCILSHWPLQKDASHTFWRTFYKHREASPKSPQTDARCLRLAMLKVKSRHPHWLHWAPWNLYV